MNSPWVVRADQVEVHCSTRQSSERSGREVIDIRVGTLVHFLVVESVHTHFLNKPFLYSEVTGSRLDCENSVLVI